MNFTGLQSFHDTSSHDFVSHKDDNCTSSDYFAQQLLALTNAPNDCHYQASSFEQQSNKSRSIEHAISIAYLRRKAKQFAGENDV